jgi:putative glutamine amidotransferase
MDRVRLNAAYIRALESVGLVPVVVPPLADARRATGVLDLVAGLVLTGGEDVDPSLYGQDPHPELGTVNCARDATELALLASARERRLPTFAICRGVQLLNVAFGGTLVQDLPSQRDEAHAHELDDLRAARVHTVRIEPASQLASVVGDHSIRVNSVHHQAIDRLGTGLRPNAWAEDGVIEGVEGDDAEWWMLGVQWHPEELLETQEHWDRRLLESFADACRANAGRRVGQTMAVSSPSTSLPSAPAA